MPLWCFSLLFFLCSQTYAHELFIKKHKELPIYPYIKTLILNLYKLVICRICCNKFSLSTLHTETLGIVLPFHRNHNLSLPFILSQKFFLRDFMGTNHEKESHLSISGLSDILFAQPVNSFNLIFKKKNNCRAYVEYFVRF